MTEFITDGRRNVLPGTATLKGDARALSTEVNETIEARIRQIVAGISSAHGVKTEVQYDTLFPSVINTSTFESVRPDRLRLKLPTEGLG